MTPRYQESKITTDHMRAARRAHTLWFANGPFFNSRYARTALAKIGLVFFVESCRYPHNARFWRINMVGADSVFGGLFGPFDSYDQARRELRKLSSMDRRTLALDIISKAAARYGEAPVDVLTRWTRDALTPLYGEDASADDWNALIREALT